MNNNLIFKNIFLFLKVVSKQRASYSADNGCGKNDRENRDSGKINYLRPRFFVLFGSVRSHAGIGG